jgi:sugar O-acyltransferase (sialic acid O-acetyltransferase NeuD family)
VSASLALWILGGGGHGRVVADAARATGRYADVVFFDDASPAGTVCGAWSVRGGSAAFLGEGGAPVERIVAIGDNRRRDEFVGACLAGSLRLAVVVHPAASVSTEARIGAGSFVAAGSVVAIGADLGPGCIVNHGASVDHDCRLGRAVHVSPGARLGGHVRVGDRSWIGIGAAVRHGVAIGSDALIGAGAAVVADVPDNSRWAGNPARPLMKRRDA